MYMVSYKINKEINYWYINDVLLHNLVTQQPELSLAYFDKCERVQYRNGRIVIIPHQA